MTLQDASLRSRLSVLIKKLAQAWGCQVFFVVFEISELGLEPVQWHALRPGVKGAEVGLFLRERVIYRNILVFALLLSNRVPEEKQLFHQSQLSRKPSISSFYLTAEGGLMSKLIGTWSTVWCSSLNVHDRAHKKQRIILPTGVLQRQKIIQS